MTETNAVVEFFEETKRQIESRGKCSRNLRCYFCGTASFDAKPCQCGNELFCAAGHRACGDCRCAHLAVSKFLKSLFETRFQQRTDSRRARLLEQLQSAATEFAKVDALPAHRKFAKRVGRIAEYFDDNLLLADLRIAFEGVLVTRALSEALNSALNKKLVEILVLNGLLGK